MVRFYFFFAKTFHRHDAVFILERIYTVADLISEEGNAAYEPGGQDNAGDNLSFHDLSSLNLQFNFEGRCE